MSAPNNQSDALQSGPVPRAIEDLCASRNVDRHTLEHVLTLAVELAREGREGRKIGTIFTVGDSDAVRRLSRPLILDPLKGHDDALKSITSADAREIIKELAQLDGGFIVRSDGVVLSAAQYFDASAEGIDLPLGLGSRHFAAAAVSRHTRAVGVVVSESSVVRVFDDGTLYGEILPELWMLQTYGVKLPGLIRKRTEGELTVFSADNRT